MLSLSVSNLVITIINILVLYLLLRKFLYKPVMGIIEKRDEMIKTQLETAKKTEQDAMQLKAQYENSLNDAHDESLRIVENSKARAQEEYSRIVKEADEQAGKIIDNARKTVELDREKAVRGMEKEVANLALVAVSKMLGEQKSAAANQALYGQFLSQVGEQNDANGN